MTTTTLELIDAISNGDAVSIENAFNAAMAEKISARLDDMKVSIAQGMFSAPEAELETAPQEDSEEV
jgi:hypothetical protein